MEPHREYQFQEWKTRRLRKLLEDMVTKILYIFIELKCRTASTQN